ncbi:hypothetical protein Y1Q_0006848 [Alligator mississippiensis]|uniref:Uncharacterized protein n=1 Tax=Alligator mississippiensis TaxID=8496 RepID=A0A151M635_ALLMI|nr:hypothetical protein Y1Q_0006848 [Alligator mississippiensis]
MEPLRHSAEATDPVRLLISKEDTVNQNGETHVKIPQKDDKRNKECLIASVPRVQLSLYAVAVMSMALNIILIGFFIAQPCEWNDSFGPPLLSFRC